METRQAALHVANRLGPAIADVDVAPSTTVRVSLGPLAMPIWNTADEAIFLAWLEDWLNTRYLRLTGGELTGNLRVPSVIVATPGNPATVVDGVIYAEVGRVDVLSTEEIHLQHAMRFTMKTRSMLLLLLLIPEAFAQDTCTWGGNNDLWCPDNQLTAILRNSSSFTTPDVICTKGDSGSPVESAGARGCFQLWYNKSRQGCRVCRYHSTQRVNSSQCWTCWTVSMPILTQTLAGVLWPIHRIAGKRTRLIQHCRSAQESRTVVHPQSVTRETRDRHPLTPATGRRIQTLAPSART